MIDRGDANRRSEEGQAVSVLYIPAKFLAAARDATEPVEVRDENGNFVGRLTPAPPEEKRPFREPPPLTEEEYRLIASQSDFSADEVMAHLERHR
jgi:hypothetical protein